MSRGPRRYEWDKLHALGSSKLVQLTAVLPVIGYLILFSASLRDHLALYVDMGGELVLWRLYVLYFGFCLLSIGALIFSWHCPDEVKTHGAGFAFVEREKPVYRSSGDRTGRLQRTVIGLRLGLIDRHGTLRPLSEDELAAVREHPRGPKTEAVVGGLPVEQLMMEYFVGLKQSKRRWRLAARNAYDAGFVLLAFPTLSVFISVSRSFVTLVAQVAGL